MNTPVFAHGHLRLYLLSLLDESPRHGYELIQALSDRFEGQYSPSAGTIYPRLAKLEEEGLVTKETSGRKTIYAITPAGREELERRRHELDEIDTGIDASVRRLADQVRAGVTTATAQLRVELGPAAKEFGEQARRFASETATQARQAWTQGVQAGQQRGADEASDAGAAAGRSGRDEAPSAASRAAGADREPRPQDAPPEPADARAGAPTGDPRGQRLFGQPAPAATGADGSEARRAEIAIERFRGDLRVEIRDAERAGRLSPSVVRLLEDELDRVRDRVRHTLGTAPRRSE